MIAAAKISEIAQRVGAPLTGTTGIEDLPGDLKEIERILPGAKTVVVVASAHSRTAIRSENVQVAQFDTIHTYNEVDRASHAVVRWLEIEGHRAAAVPSFLPIDMAPPKNGMRGAIDWREAGVRTGVGCRGECGLLVTPAYGTAVRLGGLVTDAEIEKTPPMSESPCKACQRCVEACPAHALSGGGRIDKKKCGDRIFAGGFRAWRRFLRDVAEGTPDERRALLGSQTSLELWQNFMTGVYYYCWACQAACPVGRKDP